MVITSERDSLQRLSVFEEGNTSRVSQTQVVQAKSQSRESNVNLASQKPVALITRESEIQRAQVNRYSRESSAHHSIQKPHSRLSNAKYAIPKAVARFKRKSCESKALRVCQKELVTRQRRNERVTSHGSRSALPLTADVAKMLVI